MLTVIDPVDYIIDLSTGEELHIAEFDPGRIIEMKDPAVIAASSRILDFCTKVSRDIIEEAKGGYDSRLKPLIKTPPIGALLKIPLHIGYERTSCSMYVPSKCTTKNVNPSGESVGSFPECFESETDKSSPEIMLKSRILNTAIIQSWRQNRYVVIIDLS